MIMRATDAHHLGARIGWARQQRAGREEVSALAEDLGVEATVVVAWETGQLIPDDTALAKLADCLGVSKEWLVVGNVVGSVAVRPDGTLGYAPVPLPEATAAEELLSYLAAAVGVRELARELVGRDLIAAAYSLARSHAFEPEAYRKLDHWRNRLLTEEEHPSSQVDSTTASAGTASETS